MTRLLLFILLFSAHQAAGQKTIYVSQAATGANDGTSWSDAFVFLQDGLAVAQSGDEVWVAEGVYRPDRGQLQTSLDRAVSFEVSPGVSVHGGFIGSESDLDDRPKDPVLTILSGDLLGNDPPGVTPEPGTLEFADNSLEIVRALNPGIVQTVLDNFTIKSANGAFRSTAVSARVCVLRNIKIIQNTGGRAATLVDCVLDNVRVTRNTSYDQGTIAIGARSSISNSVFEENGAQIGGALVVIGRDTLFVSNTSFVRNRARDGGVLVVNEGATVVFVSSEFVGNEAICAGGAIVVGNGSTVLTVNGLFVGNLASGNCLDAAREGGAILVHDGTLEAYNSTFAANTAGSAGNALSVNRGAAFIYNSIVSGNGFAGDGGDFHLLDGSIEISHLLHSRPMPMGVRIEAGDILAEAQFLNPVGPDGILGTLDDDHRLAPNSPAIDSGDTGLLPRDFSDLDQDGDRDEPVSLDLDGEPRIQGERGYVRPDLGAFESPGVTASGLPSLPQRFSSTCTLGVFPNPFKDRVFVTIDSRLPVRLQAFDASGRRLSYANIYMNPSDIHRSVALNSATWPRGLYLLSASNGKGTCSGVAVRH